MRELCENDLIQNRSKRRDFLHRILSQMRYQTSANLCEEGKKSSNAHSKPQQSSAESIHSLQSNQALQASALVGRKVFIKSNLLWLDAENNSTITIHIVAGMTGLKAFIYSSCGKLIKTIPINAVETGRYDCLWNGTDDSNDFVASGYYTIQVRGLYNGQEARVSTFLWANIDSVSIGHQGYGLRLNLAGVGAVSLDEIQDISV